MFVGSTVLLNKPIWYDVYMTYTTCLEGIYRIYFLSLEKDQVKRNLSVQKFLQNLIFQATHNEKGSKLREVGHLSSEKDRVWFCQMYVMKVPW